jgi:hypothetical protein
LPCNLWKLKANLQKNKYVSPIPYFLASEEHVLKTPRLDPTLGSELISTGSP